MPRCRGRDRSARRAIRPRITNQKDSTSVSYYLIFCNEPVIEYGTMSNLSRLVLPSAVREDEIGATSRWHYDAKAPESKHFPMFRQEGLFHHQGVELLRKTMGGWMRRCAELVSPLVDVMKQQVLNSQGMQNDDTQVPMLDLERGRTRTGRIWTYIVDGKHEGAPGVLAHSARRNG